MRYVMMICGDEGEKNDIPPETTHRRMDEIMAWIAKWEQAGKMLPGGAELGYSSDAKTIRAGADGQPMITDGPYLELKEVVGGFILLQAEDIDEAVAIAATWPMVGPSSSVEVRPVMER
jgi:hypothetical protein